MEVSGRWLGEQALGGIGMVMLASVSRGIRAFKILDIAKIIQLRGMTRSVGVPICSDEGWINRNSRIRC